MRNFKDESFIAQYLSPHLIREMRFFAVLDDDTRDALEVSAIHDDSGYQYVRQALARQYDMHHREPNIQVWSVNTRGDRSLTLRHFMRQPPFVRRYRGSVEAYGAALAVRRLSRERRREWDRQKTLRLPIHGTVASL